MSGQKYKKQFWIVLALLLLFALAGVGGGVGYLIRFSATSEKVCEQCHPELIELWKNSSGHPSESTTCSECHSNGKKFIPFVPPEYLADDELTSKRCLECHKEVLEWGYRVKKQVIHFNHRIHKQEDLDCVDCHRTAGHEYVSGGTNRPSVPECLECHIREFYGPPRNQKCLNCHDVMLVPGRTWTMIVQGTSMKED